MWREVRMGKYCEQCGAELEDNNKFCSKCGTKYEEDELKSNAKEKKVLGGKKKNLLIGVGIFVIILVSKRGIRKWKKKLTVSICYLWKNLLENMKKFSKVN